jgi:ribosomal protein S18 acetylase RimI-like enzyme
MAGLEGTRPEYWHTLDFVVVNKYNLEEIDRAMSLGLPELFQESFPDRKKTAERMREDFYNYAKSKYGFSLFVYEGNRIIGMGRGRRLESEKKMSDFFLANGVDPTKYFYLSTFGVNKDSRGKGIGTKMIDICCAFTPKEFIPLIGVADYNTEALKLYQKVGFSSLPFT